MIRNMVKQSCAAPGTGTTVTLSTAQPGYSSFDGFGNAQPCFYMLTDGSQSELQSGVVTVGSPSTLSRGTPLWNSAGTSVRLNFTGTCTVYNVTPAERAAYFDANNALNLAGRRVYGLPTTPTTNDEPARYDAVAWRLLSTTVFASASSGVIFTLPAAYTRFRIEFTDLIPASSMALYARLSFDNGATYRAGASDYANVTRSDAAGGSVSGGGANTYFALSEASSLSTFGVVEFASGGSKFMLADVAHYPGGVLKRFGMAGSCGFAGTATNILLGAVGGNLSSGRVRLLGGL